MRRPGESQAIPRPAHVQQPGQPPAEQRAQPPMEQRGQPPAERPGQSPAGSSPGLALVHGNLEIRPDEIQALVDGRRVGLTVREFQVLLALAQREDRVMRRGDIYSQVWGGEMKRRDRSVDVFVRKVRTKLAYAAPDWTYIHTHFGVGYRFAATHIGGGSSDIAMGNVSLR